MVPVSGYGIASRSANSVTSIAERRAIASEPGVSGEARSSASLTNYRIPALGLNDPQRFRIGCWLTSAAAKRGVDQHARLVGRCRGRRSAVSVAAARTPRHVSQGRLLHFDPSARLQTRSQGRGHGPHAFTAYSARNLAEPDQRSRGFRSKQQMRLSIADGPPAKPARSVLDSGEHGSRWRFRIRLTGMTTGSADHHRLSSSEGNAVHAPTVLARSWDGVLRRPRRAEISI